MEPREDSVIPDAEETLVPDDEMADDSAILEDDDAPEAAEDTEQSEELDVQAELEKLRRLAEENEKRFKGLQGSVQKHVERARALEAENLAMKAQAFRAQIAHLSPEQQQEAWQGFQREAQIEQREAAISSHESQIMEMVRAVVIHKMSEQYKVPMEKLMKFSNDPDQMEAFAQEYAAMRRTQRKAARRERGADRFESSQRSAPAKPKTYASIEEASAAFAKLPLPEM